MKMMIKLAVISICLFLPFTTAFGDIGMNEEQLREFIKKVIRENPQLIIETVNTYMMEMKKAQADGKLTNEQLDAILSEKVEDPVREHNPVKGNAEAPVVIIEYTDFQCSYCAKGFETIETLMKMYPGKLKVVFKNYPTEKHKQADMAAKAAMAAHKQGKFWKYHDLLFHEFPDLNEEILISFAKDLNLDMKKFYNDRDSEEIAKQINEDKDDAEKLKIERTPAFVINGVLIGGIMHENIFVSIIDRILKGEKKK